jgi:dTDP-4-amino-4,6-dideoxygalactose transaminase
LKSKTCTKFELVKKLKAFKKLGYGRQHLDESDIEAVVSALKGSLITAGPLVEKFEVVLGEYFNCKNVTVCNNGTSALFIASKALGVCSKSVVIVPSQTFLATASVPHLLGAEVVFCDVDPISGLMTPHDLRIAVSKCGKLFPDRSLQAVYVVHMNGHPANVHEISTISASAGAYLIEDACHAIGGSIRKNETGEFHKIGSCKWSDAATFSFHPVKNLTTGEGGAVSFRESQIDIKAKMIRNHGINYSAHKKDALPLAPNGQWSHFLSNPSLNFRIPDILCALGISQLKKLDKWVERRTQIYGMYIDGFAGSEHVRPMGTAKWAKPAWHLAAIHLDFRFLSVSKRTLFEQLENLGIKPQVHYQPVHLQPYWIDRYGQYDLPGASAYYKSVMSLPLFVGLENEDVGFVVENINACIG